MSEKAVELHGPFRGPQESIAVYVLQGPWVRDSVFVCLLVEDEDEVRRAIEQNAELFFDAARGFAEAKLEHWREIQCLLGAQQQITEVSGTAQSDLKGEESASTTRLAFIWYAHHPTRFDPEHMAQEILKDSFRWSVEDGPGHGSHYFERFETDPETGLTTYSSQVVGQDLEVSIRTNDEELMKGFLAEAQPNIDAMHVRLYFQEVLGKLQRGDALGAYRSFYYGFLLRPAAALAPNEEQVGDELVLALGLQLAEALTTSRRADEALWVCDTVSSTAVDLERYEELTALMRLAGIAASNLGHIDTCRKYFERAVEPIGDGNVSDTARRAHMSYGVAVVTLLGHWEHVEAPGPTAEWQARLHELVDVADKHLRIAMDLLKGQLEGTSELSRRQGLEWARQAIELDQLRVRDLRGDTEEALTALTVWLESNRVDSRLGATAIAYRLMMLSKLIRRESGGQGSLRPYLEESVAAIVRLGPPPAERLFTLNMLAGDDARQRGELGNAFEAYTEALQIQRIYAESEVQPSRPGMTYGGISAVDVSGRCQQTLIEEVSTSSSGNGEGIGAREGDAEKLWSALAHAEHGKGRFFGRAVTFAAAPKAQGLGGYRNRKANRLRSLVPQGTIDPRIYVLITSSFSNGI